MPDSAQALPGLRHHHLRILVFPPMCKIAKLEASLEKRGAVRALKARRSHQTVLVKSVGEALVPLG